MWECMSTVALLLSAISFLPGRMTESFLLALRSSESVGWVLIGADASLCASCSSSSRLYSPRDSQLFP